MTIRKGSSDPLHVWFYVGVFEVGGSNGAISGLNKSKMAAVIMDNPQRRYCHLNFPRWRPTRHLEFVQSFKPEIAPFDPVAIFENSNGDISAADHQIYSMFGMVFRIGVSNGAISGLTKFNRYVG